jgi:hypothetical protein
MATYQLLFGSVSWPEPDERPTKNPLPVPVPTEKLSVRLPRGVKAHLEEAAEREGITAEAWAERVLARNVRPNGATAH